MDEAQLIRAMQQSNDDLIRKLGIGGPTGASGGSSSAGAGRGGETPSLKKVDGIISTLLDGFTKLNRGASASGLALEGFAGVLKSVPMAGNVLSNTFGAMNGVAQDNIAGQKAMRDSGISFNNNMADFAQATGRSGQTSQEFVRLMTKMAPDLAATGANLGAGAKNVAQFNEDFQKSDVGTELLKMGYNANEVANFSTMALAGQRQRDLTDSRQRAEAVKETEVLIKQNMALAAAAGKSTAEIERMTLANTSNIDIQAEIMAGGHETQAAYSKLLPTLNALGPTISNMAQEAFTETGIKNEAAGDTYAILGPAGQMLTAAIEAQKQAAKDGATQADKDRASRMMEQAQVAIDQRMMSKQFKDMVQSRTPEGDLAKKMFSERSGQLGSLQQAQIQLRKQGQPDDVAAARAYQQNLNAASMKSVDPATGKRSVGADVIEAQNQVDVVGRAAANKVAIEGINALGKAADAAARVINTKLGGGGDKFNTPANVMNDPKSAMGGSGRTPPRDPGAPPPKQQGGSKETFGDWFAKDWGKGGLSELHGIEAVVPKDKLPEFMRDMMSSKVDAKQMEGLMPKMPEVKMPFDEKQLANMMPKMDNLKMPFNDKQISGMFDNVKMPSANINEKQMSSMMASMTSGNTGVPMAKDLLGNIKSQVSSMGTDISSAKSTTTPTALPDTASDTNTSTTTSESNTTVFNTDVLTALNSLNKMMGELVSHSQTGNEIADSMTRKIGSSNRFEG